MRHSRPVWVDPELSSYRRLTEDTTASVAIIGGGITGVSVARWLRSAGVTDIVVLEERTVCSGASGRNAGFVMAVAPENFPTGDDPARVEEARRIWQFTAENQRLIERAIEEFQLDVEYRRLGSMGLAASLTEWDWIQSSTALAREAGLEVDLIPRPDLPGDWLRENYHGGAWYASNAEINPGLYVRCLAAELAADGVKFFEQTPVGSVVDCDCNNRIETPGGSVTTPTVVLATNAYTGQLFQEYIGVIRPTRGQVLATVPLGQTVAQCPVYANDGYQYWRQRPDTSLVIGGWRDMDFAGEVGFEEVLNEPIQAELMRVAEGLCGEPVTVALRWSGIMGFTPDKRPLVGSLSDHNDVFIVAGFSGHGLAMATMAARELVDLILGRQTSYLDLFAPDRFGITV